MRPYLEYKPVDIGGTPVGPPQRQVFEPPIGALSEAAAQEIDDMKATAGIYDASLGNKSNETSGIALARREQQADVTNFHFLDNLERSFQESGKELAYVIPKFYDTERTIRILGPDESAKVVKINGMTEDGKQYKVGGDDCGKYDVIVTMGRAYSTKRLETNDMMGQLIQSFPNVFPMIADVYFRNSDMAGADELAERFKKQLPPELQEGEDGDPQQQVAQMQAQMQQLMQQHQALNQYAQQIEQENEKLKSGALTKQMEIESRERITQMQLEQQRILKEMDIKFQAAKLGATLNSQEAQHILSAEVDLMKTGAQMDAQAVAAEASAAAESM